MKVPMVAFLLLGVLLAGCASDDTGSSAGTNSSAEGNPELPDGAVDVPTWVKGQSWTYESPGIGPVNLVVLDDSGSDYLIGTDSARLAAFDARFDVSYVGPVAKADLAGQQGSDRVHYFDFPLFHGKEWSVQWDGVQLNAVAHDRDNGQFHLEYYNGDVIINQGVYDANVGWWKWLAFGDEQGNENFRMDLKGSSRSFNGDAFLLDITELDSGSSFSTPTLYRRQYDIEETYDFYWFEAQVACGDSPSSGEVNMRFRMDNGDPTGATGQSDEDFAVSCPGEGQFVSFPEAQPGVWLVEGQANPGMTSVDMEGTITGLTKRYA